ncbi:MAG: hypothetical protein AVDCRST_MAG66-2771, partial [uncultured Pseudonocardia sp.]
WTGRPRPTGWRPCRWPTAARRRGSTGSTAARSPGRCRCRGTGTRRRRRWPRGRRGG